MQLGFQRFQYNRRDKVALKTSWIKNVNFKIIKIRTGCHFIGYFHFSENANWAAQNFDCATCGPRIWYSWSNRIRAVDHRCAPGMGVGRIFSREGSIVNFSSVDKIFLQGGWKWQNIHCNHSKLRKPFFAKKTMRKCQISNSRVSVSPLQTLPTPMATGMEHKRTPMRPLVSPVKKELHAAFDKVCLLYDSVTTHNMLQECVYFCSNRTRQYYVNQCRPQWLRTCLRPSKELSKVWCQIIIRYVFVFTAMMWRVTLWVIIPFLGRVLFKSHSISSRSKDKIVMSSHFSMSAGITFTFYKKADLLFKTYCLQSLRMR